MQNQNSLEAGKDLASATVESPHSAHVTGLELIDELTYISYATNRDLGIEPAGFVRMGFSNVDAMERRYQEEK